MSFYERLRPRCKPGRMVGLPPRCKPGRFPHYWRRVESRSHLSQHAASELRKRFSSTKGTFWVLRKCFMSFS